jgi:cytochrome P450
MLVFAEHPDQWERLAADPERIANAVEEVMRHRPIVTALSRVTDEPFDHRDLVLEAGDRMVVSMVTANRDPGHFASPDAFDPDRANAGDHLTFGWGPHFCLGAGLARMELQESVRALVARFHAPRVVGHDAAIGVMGVPDELELDFRPR